MFIEQCFMAATNTNLAIQPTTTTAATADYYYIEVAKLSRLEGLAFYLYKLQYILCSLNKIQLKSKVKWQYFDLTFNARIASREIIDRW